MGVFQGSALWEREGDKRERRTKLESGKED
jgi:hypothetical protein